MSNENQSAISYQQSTMNSSLSRIKTLTHYYILTSFHNKSRLFLIVVWPIIDLLIWGFTTTYLVQAQTKSALFLTLILSTFIFWNLTIKAQQEISCQFMDDVYSRNLNNLFVSPLKPFEFLMALATCSLVKLFLVFSSLFLFALTFYTFNIFQFNYWLILFFLNLLLFGWTLGIIATAFILRFGYKLDFIAWTLAFIIQPFSCVFYPRSILPHAFKMISWLSPISYIFEGLREIIVGQKFTFTNLSVSAFLNIIYFIFANIFFIIMFKWSRKKGSLAKA